ncbi:related to spliceosome-associated-protein [Cephalotrichum gorgonifer]|uniref:Related to spliceosome-associated-protein n=1 Tax=Cephalotrichum gorgonifer TaxID=2041049 RepID=A0AAE8SWH7_9PEZI|nr:related to spliceosome-associated-protein [Cephalotrichum gorgonifer]
MSTPAPIRDAGAVLDELKPPAGVVLPPREIRNVLEKTAGYVARNGPVFEDRIRDKEQKNPKFSFLNPEDAYHAFYQWRLEEIRAGRGTAIAAGRAGEAAVPEKPKGPPKPQDFAFSAKMPRINQKDLEVLRVTAMFVARNGRQWMTQLAQREAGNPQFQFLIPNHTFHNFFQHLIDQYTELIRGHGLGGEGGKVKDERVAELKKNVEDKYHVLERARKRAEYAKFEQAERQKKEEEEVKKKEDFERIDWNDFVVVETITFTPSDATANLPPPTTLSDLQYASLEERNKHSINALRIEEAMPTDEEYQAPMTFPLPVHPGHGPQHTDSPVPAPAPQQPPASTYPAAGPTQPPPSLPVDPHQAQRRAEEESRIQERAEAQTRAQQAKGGAVGGAPLKIRENYVPRASRAAERSALCPNCKQLIPLDEMEEHMRIELLDPRWKEQKAKADSRHLRTDLSQVDVANNLKRLASQRTDVFDGVTGEPLSEEEQARRKKVAVNSFDGNPEGKSQAHISQLQRMTMEEQIKAIHDRFGTGQGQGQGQTQGPG